MTKLELLKEAVARNLAAIVSECPSTYKWPASDLPKVTAAILAVIDLHKGLGGVSIDSPTFKRTARHFGIKNTYKAWAAWLAEPEGT